DYEGGQMPQLQAFVLETFRWRPVTAGGFPHKATRDIIWKEYVIPKGATVIGNVWAVGRDPQYLPDPEISNPQRWIRDDGTLRDDLTPNTRLTSWISRRALMLIRQGSMCSLSLVLKVVLRV
ncbi:hypothetical protein H0H93_013390, partial [Arthromyces matolae]